MKLNAHVLLIAALFAPPLASYAQTNQTLNHMPSGAAVDTPRANSESSRSATPMNAAGYGEDPKAASQMGRGSDTTTLSPYSPPIRIAR